MEVEDKKKSKYFNKIKIIGAKVLHENVHKNMFNITNFKHEYN